LFWSDPVAVTLFHPLRAYCRDGLVANSAADTCPELLGKKKQLMFQTPAVLRNAILTD
jgi:hypothetical protein